MNILLADDSVPAQNMGKKILMDAGYGVVTVSNGLEALRRIAEAAPDIAILDIFMPGYTGLEICKRLRSSAATATIPVILTVGKLEPYRPEDGEEVQSNAVIVKPFAAAELISAVRSLIGGPLTEAETQPGLGGESLGDESKAVAAPLRESPLAEEGGVFPAPTIAVDTATAEPAVEIFLDDSDEPLFANQAEAPRVYGSESPLFGSDSNGPASLAFDPDARQTPFSASVTDLVSPTSQWGAESGASAFTEFDLASEPSGYSAGAGQEGAQEVAREEAAATGSPELELPALDAPASGPLLGIAPEQTLAELAPSDAAASEIPASPAARLSPDELSWGELSSDAEARRAAFEALFNSTEEIATAPETLPGIVELPEVHPGGIELEIGAPVDEQHQQYFAAPGVDANAVEAVQPGSEPLNGTGTAPELLDDLLPALLDEPSEAAARAQAASEGKEEAIASDLSRMASPLPGEAAGFARASLPYAALASEAAAGLETPGVYEPAPPAEIIMPELAAAASHPGREVVPPAVMQSESRQPTPEPLHAEAEMPLAEAAPMHVEAAPMLEVAEAEPLESAQTEREEQTGEICSPPGLSSQLNEAERIHHAIERVFDRFKPLLVAAIVRELARHD